MTIQELADTYVGHPEEIDEDCTITMQREAFKCGALKVLKEMQTIIDKHPLSSLAVQIEDKIIELADRYSL